MPYEPKVGDALIDTGAVFPDLGRLHEEFDILYFLDFCAGLEAAVVQSRLVSTEVTGSRGNQVVRDLIEADVLQAYRVQSSDPMSLAQRLVDHPRAVELQALIPQLMPGEKLDLYSAIFASVSCLRGDLGFEEMLRIPYLPSAHELPLYLAIPSVADAEKAFNRCRLSALSQDLTSWVSDLRQKYDGPLALPFPPIALDVLEKATTLEDIGPAVLQVRETFSPLRNHFVTLDETLRSNDISPLSKMREEAALIKAMSDFRRGDDIQPILALADLALNETTPRLPTGRVDWNSVADEIVKNKNEARWSARLRPLYATQMRHLDRSVTDIARIVKRLFEYEISRKDQEKVIAYQSEIEGFRQKTKLNRRDITQQIESVPGDTFQNVTNSIIVNRSVVLLSFEKLKHDSPALAEAIARLFKAVHSSGDLEAGRALNQFSAALLEQGYDRNSVLSSWDRLATLLPPQSDTADNVGREISRLHETRSD
jgi:hypothetical protein